MFCSSLHLLTAVVFLLLTLFAGYLFKLVMLVAAREEALEGLTPAEVGFAFLLSGYSFPGARFHGFIIVAFRPLINSFLFVITCLSSYSFR